MGFIREDKTNGNNNGNNEIKTISSKVLATVPASDVAIDDLIIVNNVSINKDRRYYIEFLGSKKLCSLLVSEELGNCIICSIGGYFIQAVNDSTNISIYIGKINEDDTATDTFTDLIIYEEEVKYLDSKYLETNLVLQNSISLGRVGDIGMGSSAIGSGTTASGNGSHAEGGGTTASGECAHAEGEGTIASGMSSHAEGSWTTASGEDSHAEGESTKASSKNQHVQGKYNIEDTEGKYAHIVGNGTDEDTRSNAHTLDWEGNAWYAGEVQATNLPYTVSSKVLATVPANDITLDDEITVNNVSINKDRRYYIEFLGSKKLCSMVTNKTISAIICNIGNYIIQASKDSTNISVYISKINEDDTTTDTFTDLVIYEKEVKYLDSKYLETNLVLQNSISLGRVGNIGMGSSAIGSGVIASGNGSHAEGAGTTASGVNSHAEGHSSTASGYDSHAEGNNTKASSQYQHVQGKFNIEDKTKKYAHIVGNGEYGKRSNAHTLDWEGNAWYSGKLSQEGTPTEDKDLTTKKYVDDNILLEQLPILRIDETNKRIYVNCNNMGTYKKYFVPNKYANVYGFSFIYTNEDSSETEIALIGGAMTRDDFILCARNTNTLFILILGGTDKYTYTKSTKTLEKGLYGYLKIGNTQEYAPTENYHPATKKYVDDKIKDTLVTTNISGTTLSLTTDKYQTATIVDGTEITLPAVTSFTEIHLFFSTTTDLTLTLPACKWQNGNIPTISANKTYEFIFTYTTEWLGGVIQYE